MHFYSNWSKTFCSNGNWKATSKLRQNSLFQLWN